MPYPLKPTLIKLAEGDARKIGKRKLQEKLQSEPKAPRGFPACPAHLGEIAREAWAFLSEEIERMNLDFRPDSLMLEGACVAYEDARNGTTAAERTKAWILFHKFGSEFGLSPVARTRIQIKRKDPVQDLEALLA